MVVFPFLLSVWCSLGSHAELLIIILGDVTILPQIQMRLLCLQLYFGSILLYFQKQLKLNKVVTRS